MILGHEGAGIVAAVGSDVTTCAVGDHVVLSALIHCGMCDHCVKGRPNLCLWGLQTIFGGRNPDGGLRATDPEGRELFQFSSIGTLAEELICHETHAVPIPRGRVVRGGVPHRVRGPHRAVSGDEPGERARRLVGRGHRVRRGRAQRRAGRPAAGRPA